MNPRNSYMLLFMIVVVVMWFGCNNAAKEIVKEEAIYSRERAVNLGVAPYLASKFLVLSAVTVLHALILMAVVFGALEGRAALFAGYDTPPPDFQARLRGPVRRAGAAVDDRRGVRPACCRRASPRRIGPTRCLPYVLIPQFILGGGFLSVKEGMLPVLAWFLSPVYWAYRAVHLGANRLPDGIPRLRRLRRRADAAVLGAGRNDGGAAGADLLVLRHKEA